MIAFAEVDILIGCFDRLAERLSRGVDIACLGLFRADQRHLVGLTRNH